MSTLDPNALAMLTDEERAAIEDEDGFSPEELAAIKAIAGDPDSDEDSDSEDDEAADTDEDPDADEDADTSTDQESDPDPNATPEPDPDPVPDPAPAAKARATGYDAQLPEGFEDQVTALAEKERALKTRFRDGDIDFEGYESERDELTAQRETLTIARAKVEISREINSQSAAQQWQTEVDQFLDGAAKADGLDYRSDKDKAGDLDQFIKVLAANEANSDKSMEWFLTQAHKRVKVLHDIPATATKQEPSPVSRKTAAQANAERKPATDKAPKTLAQVPGATGADEFEGEFASLDVLEGEDLEAAIAKMTPAQRMRFAKA